MSNKFSRRRFLVGGLIAGSGVALARDISGAVPLSSLRDGAPVPADVSVYTFFTAAEAAFVEATVARLIPADERGAGALEAGCAHFIDNQLAGAYGNAQGLYMHGPWPAGTPQQGYQSRQTPAEIYRAAIAAIDDDCREQFAGKTFAQLPAAEQDQQLTQLEQGKLDLGGIKSDAFFQRLLQNTVEGFFADPIYGGNRDMIGWKLIGFGGARYDYSDWVERHGEAYPLPPVGLKGRPEWTPKT
jgi:gluconate 2-dehydrogenase gamma chain